MIWQEERNNGRNIEFVYSVDDNVNQHIAPCKLSRTNGSSPEPADHPFKHLSRRRIQKEGT